MLCSMNLIVMLVVVHYGSCTVFKNALTLEWNDWKVKHGKSYVNEEEFKRMAIWQENYFHVVKHNYEFDLGKHTYQLAMNRFADMTTEEYKTMLLGLRGKYPQGICQKNVSFSGMSYLPESVDWRKKGYVTPVKDQGNCGSCYAFSTTGVLEGQHFRKTGKLVSLSEQNLMDCSRDEGDRGCEGGLMVYAYKYILEAGGIDTENSYPYDAKDEKCRFRKNDIGATLTGCVDLPSGDENALKAAVAKIGPIAVGIDANLKSFQLYNKGVYYSKACKSDYLDHGVLVVGYGTENGDDYWLVKNSWGQGWGIEGGYIKMARNKNNNCGIASIASYPTV